MAGYTRNDTANNIADGNIINASDLDGEFDAVQSAFNASTGHTHDGTAGEGAPIEKVGPVQDLVITASEVKPKTTNTLDLGTSLLQYKDLYIEGSAYIDGLGESMLVDGSSSIQFRDSALAINSSTDGQLDIDADIEIEITVSDAAGIVDINSDSVNISNDLNLDSDGAILSLGADGEVTLTHVHNTGLDLKNASGFDLNLQTSDTTIESGNLIGKITFNAPDEAGGSDAILVGASIEALAEATFDSTTNSTAIVFKTNTSGAATERMRITSAGDLHFLDNRKAIFGAGSDLQIYHDGSKSIIHDNGAGQLLVRTNQFNVNNAGNTEKLIEAIENAQVDLYYNNDLKLSTTNTGIDVDGTVTADGLTVDTDTLYVDAVNNRVGVGTDSPSTELHVASTFPIFRLEDTDSGGYYSQISQGGNALQIEADSNNVGGGSLRLKYGGTEAMRIDSSGNFIFNEDGNDSDFRVESNDVTSALYVDGADNYIAIHGKNATLSQLYLKNFEYGSADGSSEECKLEFGWANHSGAAIAAYKAATNRTGLKFYSEFGYNTEALMAAWERANGINFNPDQNDQNFKILSVNNANMLFVDAGNDQVNIGTSTANTSASSELNVGGVSEPRISLTSTGSGTPYGLIEVNTAGSMGISADPGTSGPTTTNIAFNVDTVETARFYSTQAVFNEGGSADVDFRVESDGNAFAIFVDAAEDAVTMKTSSPSDATLTVFGSGTSDYNAIQIRNSNTANVAKGGVISFAQYDDADTSFIGFGGFDSGTVRKLYIGGGSWQIEEATEISFYTGAYDAGNGGAPERATISDASFVINQPGNDFDFRVESDGNPHAIFVDASAQGGNGRVGILESAPDVALHVGADGVSGAGGIAISSNISGTYRSNTMYMDTFSNQGRFFQTGPDATTRGSGYLFHSSESDGGNTLELCKITASETVFNDSAADMDFRVESDSFPSMIFVDASADCVGINRSDPQHFLDVYSVTSSLYNIRCRSDRAAGQNFIGFDYGAGNLGAITGNGSVLTYGGTSDHRLKTNVQALSGSIDRVKSLNPVTFDWIASGLGAEGFIAHELQSVVPTAVTGEHNEVDDEGSPVYQQVDPRNVVPLLTSALQEAIAKIESLEARVAQLEAN